MQHETIQVIDTATLHRRLSIDEQKNAHKRRFERHKTFIIAQMMLMDTAHRFDGVVNEVSQGGMRFRPASRFLQKRSDTVTLVLADRSFSGRIRASRPDGYGIELLEPLSEEDLQDLLRTFEVPAD